MLLLWNAHESGVQIGGTCRHLTSLESLEICGGAVTDRGVSHMGPLMSLKHLSLAQNARITDASLLTVSALTSLTFLNLAQSKLTGNGIQHLHNLTVRLALCTSFLFLAERVS